MFCRFGRSRRIRNPRKSSGRASAMHRWALAAPGSGRTPISRPRPCSGEQPPQRCRAAGPPPTGSAHHAASEAGRLGLEMATFSSAGWSETGGPWVQFELAQRFKARAITLSSRGAIPFGRRSELARAGSPRRRRRRHNVFQSSSDAPTVAPGPLRPQKNCGAGYPRRRVAVPDRSRASTASSNAG
jgi:hypothetical protein